MRGPFSVLAKTMFPIGSSARRFAHSQTQLDQAVIACALERYRLAHAAYPETLEGLSPDFMDKIPHDLISGEPMKYRRTDDGQYILYSIGWNETDDGGLDTQSRGKASDLETGDWVWRLPVKPEPGEGKG